MQPHCDHSFTTQQYVSIHENDNNITNMTDENDNDIKIDIVSNV